jgi:aldehyde:ferredoxin oxidoreductase
MNGWMGRVLRVNLSSQTIQAEPLREDLIHAFIGGRGLSIASLHEALAPGIDALGPKNVLIFAPGPSCGTVVPGSQRWTVGAKSPLTGLIGDSNCGGSFGVGLKYAGYDAVIIEGQSQQPVYLLIEDNAAVLRDATHLWGKTTGETERRLKKELGDPDVHIATTGTAGDHLVKFATVYSDNRKAGRTGMGAVMGSKKLKAVVAKGSEGVRVADPDAADRLSERIRSIWRGSPRQLKTLREYGAGVHIGKTYHASGIIPTRNYQEGVFPAYDALAERLKDELWLKPRACFSCPVACAHVYVVPSGPYQGTYGDGLYGSSIWYSARLGNPDVELMCKLTTLSDQYGVDEANLSGVLGWLMECYERGLIKAAELDGVEMHWGNPESILGMTERIVHRTGIGDILAEGALNAARAIGRGTEQYVMHVKGMDLDSRDPRGSKSWGLGFAVGSRGADHCRHVVDDFAEGFARLEERGKGALHKVNEDLRAFQHAFEICLFVCDPPGVDWAELLAQTYTAVTGVDIGAEGVMAVGERIVNLERAFNLREGLTRSDDTLPTRFLKERMARGPAQGQTVDLDLMIDEYYAARGWDRATGFPKRHKLEELGLQRVADELQRLGKLG